MSCLPLSKLRPLWIACALALAARAEAAEPSAVSQAWMLSFNYGGGNLGMGGDSLDFGLVTRLSLGHIVRRGVMAGFQARSWGTTDTGSLPGSSPGTTDLSHTVLILTMTATMYPKGSGGYVRGGAGVCKVRQEFVTADPLGGPSAVETHEDAGFAVTAAGGWEHRLRARLGATIDLEYSRFVAAHVGGNLFTYTAGLNYSW